MPRDRPVAELDESGQSRHSAQSGRPGPARLIEDEEHRLTGSEDLSTRRNHVHGLFAGRSEGGIGQRPWGFLKRGQLEAPRVVLPPDPGGNPPSETSVAVPKDDVTTSIFRFDHTRIQARAEAPVKGRTRCGRPPLPCASHPHTLFGARKNLAIRPSVAEVRHGREGEEQTD